MNTRRIRAAEVEESKFYKMPKFIIHDKQFDKLNSDAKILYMIMRDRNELSIQNNWIDNEGYVYIIYTRESMMNDVNLSNKTVIKAVNDLKRIGLIEEKRQGVNKPNLIYVLTIELDNQWKCNNYTSRNVLSTSQEVNKVHGNNTNIKNTNSNIISTNDKIKRFNSMYSHDWDFDEIERLERERIDKIVKDRTHEI